MTDGQRKKVASSFIAWRFFLVSIVIAAVFVALASRAAYIQILEPDMAIDENNKRTLRVEALHAQRGMIFDRHGKELAVSVPVVSVYADPKALEKSLQQKVLKLAKKQGENIDALQKKFDRIS